jgi:hypothetical protein
MKQGRQLRNPVSTELGEGHLCIMPDVRRMSLGWGGVFPNGIVLGQVCNVNIVDQPPRVWSSMKVEASVFSMIFHGERGKLPAP